MPTYYFAYGTNLNKKTMLERCPEARPLYTATLHSYKLIFVGWSRQWHGGVATIRRVTGQKVPGAIYEVTDDCLRRLDLFEGRDAQRLKVLVHDEDGQAVEAITYIKIGQIEETRPSEQYVSIIRQAYRDLGIA